MHVSRPQRLLVTFAVREEARFFQPPSVSPLDVRVCVTGMGARQAVAALEAALGRPGDAPALVLTCGFAGGLDPALNRGDLVLEADAGFQLAPALLAAGARPGTFHCAERIASTAAEKRRLRTATQAEAVEMESGAIRALCRRRGVSSATLRVISDAADEDLPLDFNALLRPDFKLSYVRLAGALARAPGKLPALIALGRNSAAAARQLGHCLEDMLRRVAE